LKIFEFEEKIPAFIARMSVLITVFQVFASNFVFNCQAAYLVKKTLKKIRQEKIEEITFAMFSELV
jgi:hypothetical protein